METSSGVDRMNARLILPAALAVWLALAFVALRPLPARADPAAPPVPGDLEVEAGNEVFLVGHAIGSQNYICLAGPSGFAWTFFGPQATLFNEKMDQISTHFLSSNPVESGAARATWQDSQDTSTVWAAAIATSTDPNYVAPGAIPWLLLKKVGTQAGPTGGDALAATTFIQRVNTSGGLAPASGCARKTDIGKKALVPYTADYVFYRASGN